MQDSFYAKFCNHWVALIGVGYTFHAVLLFFFFFFLISNVNTSFVFFQALSSILIMFVIQWIYALANIVIALLLFLYIGKTSPGLPLGDFHHLNSCLETLSLASWWGAVRVTKCPEFCVSFVLYTTCTCAAPSSLVCQSELWTWDAFGRSRSVVLKREAFCEFTRSEQNVPKIIQYCRLYTGYRVYVWIKSRCSCWVLPCDFFFLSHLVLNRVLLLEVVK